MRKKLAYFTDEQQETNLSVWRNFVHFVGKK